jgi:choline dehydrogenase-like flavoprotein
VLNRYNQVWDAPNFAVTDASAFRGSGVAGTTLTVMALTLLLLPRHLVDGEEHSP